MTTNVSPRGRTIEYLEGDPDAIVSRGQKITDLGDAMESSAYWLGKIKDDAADQQGKAIEALREIIGESSATLAKAADLYTPVGPVLTTYGEELQDLKPKINALADNCIELAQKVPAVVTPEPDDAGDEDEDAKGAREAQEDWEDEAELFDAAYDEWEDAFEKAVNGITDEMGDEIADGGWRTFWNDLGTVLEVAGLVLAIAAIFITGPVIFWVALGVGLAALAVTLVQATYGDKGAGDIGMAVLGVIPFGKLGTGLAKSSRLFSKSAPKIFQGASRFSPSLDDAPAANRLVDSMMRGLSGKSLGDFHLDVAMLGASNWGPDVAGAAVNAIGGFVENGLKAYSGSQTVGNMAS